MKKEYSDCESAIQSRIRAWARRCQLKAVQRKGRWYFAGPEKWANNEGPGFTDKEALDFLIKWVEKE
jgi:hypothetical protein